MAVPACRRRAENFSTTPDTGADYSRSSAIAPSRYAKPVPAVRILGDDRLALARHIPLCVARARLRGLVSLACFWRKASAARLCTTLPVPGLVTCDCSRVARVRGAPRSGGEILRIGSRGKSDHPKILAENRCKTVKVPSCGIQRKMVKVPEPPKPYPRPYPHPMEEDSFIDSQPPAPLCYSWRGYW